MQNPSRNLGVAAGCNGGICIARSWLIRTPNPFNAYPPVSNVNVPLYSTKNMADTDCETTDVVICGCGPTGAMLSAYLGRMSIPHVVIEKEPEITTDPRGIALDEDGIRALQGAGIYDPIYSDIGTCEDIQFVTFYFFFLLNQSQAWASSSSLEEKRKSLTGRLSWKWIIARFVYLSPIRIFLLIRLIQTEGGTGHVGFICHKQPVLEKYLRNAMTSSSFCQLQINATMIDIREEGDHVYSQYRDAQGKIRNVKSRFLVGADGKTGFTRKNFMEPLGIRMEPAHQ